MKTNPRMALLSLLGLSVLAGGMALAAPTAAADPVEKVAFDMPEQKLEDALAQLALKSNLKLVYYTDLGDGLRAPALTGTYTAAQALERILAPTGLRAEYLDDRTVAIRAGGPVNSTGKTAVQESFRLVRADNAENSAPFPQATAGTTAASSAEEKRRASTEQTRGESTNEVVVTGTNIRGADVATIPVTSISQRDMIEAGQNNLGEVVRSLPQNFSGGQNPGVRNGGGNIANQNISSGSSINLRGLGPDATLTLLNGRRLSYNSFVQAVDISVIPLAAVDRIEIVADGASAIYGSDAVAGVANVILKRDFQGIGASARFGASTAGGNEQNQYSLVGGNTWGAGGFIMSYDYEKIGAIDTEDRAYTRYMIDPSYLVPETERHNVLVSAHHAFTPSVSVGIDALYNKRDVVQMYASATSRSISTPTTKNNIISPWITVGLPAAWSMTLSGSFGKDESEYYSLSYNNAGVQTSFSNGCYCNDVTSGELGFEGMLFELPAGGVRAATGGGYRKNSHETRSFTSTSLTIGDRESKYAYAELFVPLVSPAQGRSGVDRLSFTGALRYEDYRDLGNVTTPKLGFIYAPTEALQFKASWGKSFKAANLLQEYQDLIPYIMAAANVGGVGYPPNATILMTWGGNRNLKPERSTAWSTTMSLTPASMPGFTLDLSYFDVEYTDRVVQPISPYPAALSNPIFEEFLVRSPTLAQINAVIATGTVPLNNISGLTYDPANVVAIAYNQYTNVAREDISGVDLNARYAMQTSGGTFIPQLQASWLDSERKNSTLAAPFALSGTVYNPSHLRARGGLVWRNDTGLTLSSFVNYIGKLDDIRTQPNPKVDPMTTIDFTAVYRMPSSASFFSDLTLGLSVLNLTDERPPFLLNTSINNENYDSTNHSAIGRFVNFSVTKQWGGR